ncbi:MAG TPA: nitroreductase family deazaflavin-dependent oxidoreductase [Candidatus Limnocylindrales bacterium]|jgi:deazaflavin-dependent oxidoreductase (nitroreductase family)|nr:nitroreductase family deazaflavin-dependent oxidoreductase [Candidatus Limnocylindrales bacterium]
MTSYDMSAELAVPGSLPTKLRFGGVLWRLTRRTTGMMLPLAGKGWNPIFAVVEHRGRRSGRAYSTPVAARRVGDGFVISLAFGAHVDWYRNLLAAGGGALRWRGREYRIASPQPIAASRGLAAFNPLQRLLIRIARVDGFVVVRDVDDTASTR